MSLNVRVAVRSACALWRHHMMEAALAVLGVVVGAGGLVVVVCTGAGSRAEMERALGALGTGTIVVRSLEGASIPEDRSRALERLLGADLRRQVPIATRVVTATSAGRELPSVKLVATEPGYRDAFALAVAEGRFLAASDTTRAARVCVLGGALARELFPRGDALGSNVRLERTWHRVVGVLRAAGSELATTTAMSDVNRLAIVPLPAERARVPLDAIVLSFADEADMVRAGAAVQRIAEFGTDGTHLEYEVPVELIRQKQALQRTIAALLAGVTVVLFVVGGISITNVMSMNVLRRRGEIGLRRAIGATQAAIVMQFLTEAMLVCGGGGVIGVLVGLSVSTAMATLAGWPTVLVPSAAVAALVASVLLGAIAGGYPAYLAARVEPMRSLA
jgi:putative ABC transport system permease protein